MRTHAPTTHHERSEARILPLYYERPSTSRDAQGRVRRAAAVLSAVVGLCAVTACADPAPAAGPPLAEILPMETPAAPGSEEPYLSSFGDEMLLSWLVPVPVAGEGDGGARTYELRVSSLQEDEWSAPRSVAASDRFFVNWADFPSVEVFGETWVAHWLVRGDAGGYDYGVRLAHSTDRGATWSEPWIPHGDDTPTEHGFVTLFPTAPDAAGEVGALWLDGRRYARGPAGGPPTEEMGLRYRSFEPGGERGPERLLDERVCDCCQTDAALTPSGPVVVYRDRSTDEIRDVYLSRLVDGRWTDGRPVHRDGWHIAACPVNGPAVAAGEASTAVAWFTGADGSPRVQVAFSRDDGATFGTPVRVDDGAPGGRVDVVALDDGSAVVSWLERVGEEGAEVRARRVWPDGTRSAHSTVARSEAARASGFPQMARTARGDLLFAWTDSRGETPRVRVATSRLRGPTDAP